MNELIKATICHCIVCSDEGPEAAVEWVNTHHPTGIRSQWEHHIDREDHTVQCLEHPDRKHYLMVC